MATRQKPVDRLLSEARQVRKATKRVDKTTAALTALQDTDCKVVLQVRSTRGSFEFPLDPDVARQVIQDEEADAVLELRARGAILGKE